MAYITDDTAQDPNGTCSECSDPQMCKSIRWHLRPCEQAVQPQPTEPPAPVVAPELAPWQRERPCESAGAQRVRLQQAEMIREHLARTRQQGAEQDAKIAADAAVADAVYPVPRPEGSNGLQYGNEGSPDMHQFASGAKSSEHKLRYDLIPWHIFADRLAKRYTDGAVKYGEFNWQKGLRERAYVLDRANHTLAHLHRAVELIRERSLGAESGDMMAPVAFDDDDDLAAAMWGIIFLMAAQRGGAEL
jgi:hypothetical protein